MCTFAIKAYSANDTKGHRLKWSQNDSQNEIWTNLDICACKKHCQKNSFSLDAVIILITFTP